MKAILKYSTYGFIGGWMFFLGVMVGRGHSPVTFDTRGFQDRLAAIARQSQQPVPQAEDGELRVYDVKNDQESKRLERRVIPKESSLMAKTGSVAQKVQDPEPKPLQPPETPFQAPAASDDKAGPEEIQKKTPVVDETRGLVGTKADAGSKSPADSEPVPVKTSKKAASLDTEALSRFKKGPAGRDDGKKAPKVEASAVAAKPPADSDTGKETQAGHKDKEKDAGPSYTIQVASYRSLDDALNQMHLLDKKGFASNRTQKEIDGTVWYRVRCGSFTTRKDAQAFLDKLEAVGFKGLILKVSG